MSLEQPIGYIYKVNPFVDCPDAPDDSISMSLKLGINNLTPLGHRSLNLTEYPNINVKGYFLSPVHVYGLRAEEEIARTQKFINTQGNFAGKATADDLIYEKEVFKILKERVPESFFCKDFPIWKLIGYSFTGQMIEIWREDNIKVIDGILIYRNFPNTAFRLADFFIEGAEIHTIHELEKLRSFWNLGSHQEVFAKAVTRLAKGFNALDEVNLVHGNMYWRGRLGNLEYGRPNLHNISPDGSFGDFEKPDPKYGLKNTETLQSETVGGLVSYLLMVYKVNANYFDRSEFTSNLVALYAKSLNPNLKEGLKNGALQKVARDMENRLVLSRSGYSVKNGIEFFNMDFYSKAGVRIQEALKMLEKIL